MEDASTVRPPVASTTSCHLLFATIKLLTHQAARHLTIAIYKYCMAKSSHLNSSTANSSAACHLCNLYLHHELSVLYMIVYSRLNLIGAGVSCFVLFGWVYIIHLGFGRSCYNGERFAMLVCNRLPHPSCVPLTSHLLLPSCVLTLTTTYLF